MYCFLTDSLIATSTFPSCSKEELMMFFPQPIVKNVLVLDAHLDEKDAEDISTELAIQDKGLAQLVDERASRYTQNPFKDLSQRDQAIKIYQETLFEVFANVLKGHGIKDEQQIRTLLDEIRSVKSKMFIDCIRKEQAASQNP